MIKTAGATGRMVERMARPQAVERGPVVVVARTVQASPGERDEREPFGAWVELLSF